MADTFSTHYNWTIPAIGTSGYAPKVNADIEAIDGDLFTVSEAADDAQDAADAAQDDATAALNASAAITPVPVSLAGGDPYTGTVDLSLGNVFVFTQTYTYSATDINLTFTNRPATKGTMVYLHFILTGSGLGGHIATVKSISAQSQWVLPFQLAVLSSGAQILGTINTGAALKTYLLPVYIVAGV